MQSHTAEYGKYFDRVSLDLGANAQAAKPTDVRVREFESNFDPQLAALYFQFGRYLLICSSQPGGQAANLQGIWNYKLRAPWKIYDRHKCGDELLAGRGNQPRRDA